MRKFIFWSIIAFFCLCVLSAFAVIASALVIETRSDGRIYTDSSELPKGRVGLVLGCSRYLENGRENLYFKYRISSATELYKKGKVQYLIVSGDNSRNSYDEPTDMKKALLEKGVPEGVIYCDYAGFSTLDSIVRAKEVFLQSDLVVISQDFHVKRAIFIGRAKGLEVTGFAARGVTGGSGAKTDLRETLARVKAVLDVYILSRQPRFLGDPVFVG